MGMKMYMGMPKETPSIPIGASNRTRILDYAGDNVKVWAWTEEGWVALNALRQKTTLPEFRDKGCGIASRIESIDFEEMSIISEKHVERHKTRGARAGTWKQRLGRDMR